MTDEMMDTCVPSAQIPEPQEPAQRMSQATSMIMAENASPTAGQLPRPAILEAWHPRPFVASSLRRAAKEGTAPPMPGEADWAAWTSEMTAARVCAQAFSPRSLCGLFRSLPGSRSASAQDPWFSPMRIALVHSSEPPSDSRSEGSSACDTRQV